jgi:hypothetical protein
MQMEAAELGKRFEQHFINYQNTKAIRKSIVYLYTTPSMQLPTILKDHLLIDYAYCYYTLQKCASSLPASPPQ